MVGIAAAHAAQDVHGFFDRWFLHHHRLEAAFQGGVAFDVLAVLVQGRGADHLQLAAGQRRLEDVGGVHRAFGGPRAHHGVQFVDEQHRVGGTLDLVDHLLETFLELAAVLGAGHQRAHVQGQHAPVAQRFRHFAADDALGQTLHDGRLADAGFADEGRVVLGSAAENLDHPLDLVVPADHRVQLVGAGGGGEVDAHLVHDRGLG